MAVVSFLLLVKVDRGRWTVVVEMEVEETSSVFVITLNKQILFCVATCSHTHTISGTMAFAQNMPPYFCPRLVRYKHFAPKVHNHNIDIISMNAGNL